MRFQFLLFLFTLLVCAKLNANNGATVKTVVIDAGHGGKDPGTIGQGKVNEKDIALVVALKLGDYIQRNFTDVNVIYTRKTDVFLELHERAEIANKNKADLFIAIHCNSSPNNETFGSSTYVLGLHRTEANLEVAKRENAVINLEANKEKNYEFDPNSPEGHIIMSMKQNAFLDQSIDLASKVENQFENYAHRKSLGVKQAGFYVLYKTAMPSILAEIGFLSNNEEEKILNSVKGQDLIATALLKAFKDYKSEIEGGEANQLTYNQPEKTTTENKTETKTETKVETKTETKTPVKTEVAKIDSPKAVAKTETKINTNTQGTNNISSISPEPAFASLISGKKIRIPVENSSGGGTTVKKVVKDENPNEVKPIYVHASNLNPFDTTSMSSMMNKDGTMKAESKKDKPVTENKTETKTETKTENKAEVKKDVKTETKTETKTNPTVETKIENNKSTLVPDHVSESGIVFKVQLFALKGELKDYDKISKLSPKLSAENLVNGFTRYYVGSEKKYADAKKILDAAKAANYSAAFIVGFNDGNRMGADEMKIYEHK